MLQGLARSEMRILRVSVLMSTFYLKFFEINLHHFELINFLLKVKVRLTNIH